MIPDAINLGSEMFCTDVSVIEFAIVYDNSEKARKRVVVSGDVFGLLFLAIARFVPRLDDIPEMNKIVDYA